MKASSLKYSNNPIVYNRLPEWTRKQIENGKRLTKFDLAVELDRPLGWSAHYVIALDCYLRPDLVAKFNSYYGTFIN